VDAFLRAYPEGIWTGDALALARKFVAEDEPREFDAAWEAGTTAKWDEYLARHPQSPRLVQARECRQEAHEFEMAVQMDKPVMWRAFLKAWPDGRHRLDAELRSP
jgi:hypothetical protein